MARVRLGHFNGRQQVSEEALLGLLEGGVGGGLRRGVQGLAVLHGAGGFQGRHDVLVDDAEGAGVTVPDVALRRGEGVLEDVDFDAVVGQRARLVETEGLQVAGDDLQRGDAAAFHRADEVRAVVEGGRVAAPEAEARRVGEAVDGAGAGGGGVEHAGVGQGVLQAQSGEPLLQGLGVATGAALRSRGVGHGVRFVEHDDAVEGVAGGFVGSGEPGEDLVEARRSLAAGGAAQGGVGGEQDAAAARDGLRRPVVGEREDVVLVAAELAPVAAGVVDQARGLRDPQGASGAAQPAVEDHGSGLASLAAAGAVAEHPALAELDGLGEWRVDRDGAVNRVAVFVDGDGANVVGVDAVAGGQQAFVGLSR